MPHLNTISITKIATRCTPSEISAFFAGAVSLSSPCKMELVTVEELYSTTVMAPDASISAGSILESP